MDRLQLLSKIIENVEDEYEVLYVGAALIATYITDKSLERVSLKLSNKVSNKLKDMNILLSDETASDNTEILH